MAPHPTPMLTTGHTHEKPHRADRRWGGVAIRDLFSRGLGLCHSPRNDLSGVVNVPVIHFHDCAESAELLGRRGIENEAGLGMRFGSGVAVGITAHLQKHFAEGHLRASTFSTVCAGRFGADGGWDRAEGLGCFVFGGHGIRCLIGASSPADGKTITPRRVIAMKISNYFHGPKTGSFSLLNETSPSVGATEKVKS